MAKKRKILLILLLLAIAFAAVSAILLLYSRGRMEGISDTGISTGVVNNCLVYDAEDDITLVGTTSSNELIAYQGSKELWRTQGKGAFSSIAINRNTDLVYAGNQDYNVYLYDLKTGKEKGTINTQRRVIAIDVSESGNKIAVATLTGTSKASLIAYDLDGNQLFSKSVKVKISGVEFAGDDEIITGNNRGELTRYDLSGEEQGKYNTNYSIMQVSRVNNTGLALSKNGTYCFFDDDLNILRSGAINNTVQAVPSSIGCDGNSAYVAVGTKEGYIFVLNRDDRQVTTLQAGSTITSFAPDRDRILFTGNGDFVKEIHVNNLIGLDFNKKIFTASSIILTAAIIAAALLLFLYLPQTGPCLSKLGKEIWKARMAYILLLPGLLLVWFFNYRGIFTAFIRAFTNWSINNNTLAQIKFVGFDNFRQMFTEGYFLVGMKNLLILILTGVVKVLTVPVLLAWLCYSIKGDKRKYIHRFLLVLPIVVPGVISAMIWLKIYDPNIGLINELLIKMGLSNLTRVWLGDAHTAIWAIVFMGFPFVNAMAFLVYYGGLLGIGHDVEESAIVDGANRWNLFWKIQIPLLRPSFRVMLTLTLIGTMQNFNEIYILTQGGPGTSTYVPALELYFNVSQFGRYGYACALGVMLFLMTMLVTVIQLYFTREKSE